MPRLRLALAQADLTVGDASQVLAWTARAVAEGAHVVAFPPLALDGGELARRLAARGLGDIVVLAGLPGLRALYRGTMHDGGAYRIGGVDVAAEGPGAGLVVHGCALPYEPDADDSRLAGLAARAAAEDAVVACVNLVGALHELVFDGDSMVVRPDGALIARAPQFVEKLLVLDLDLPAGTRADALVLSDAVREPARPAPPPEIAARLTGEAEAWQALVLGLRDHARQSGFRSAALDLSDGIESAVAAAIACDALGPAAVVGVSMPALTDSREGAQELARRTGLDFRVEPIQPMLDGFLANLALDGVALKNLHERVRGVVLMALADQEGHLALYGDLHPLRHVPGPRVRSLARWRNEEAERRGQPAPIPGSGL
ncbi:nitrilase-related carbon-nitrogen hydrolase [Dactylosporangium sp. CA-139066]|uniref:nitrilase-related carbon-nitrogen hydrolase n=1 Tax=Dactylosporangium sp. CA-139066 TaxID=3239930 RepID=UPI003D93E1E7